MPPAAIATLAIIGAASGSPGRADAEPAFPQEISGSWAAERCSALRRLPLDPGKVVSAEIHEDATLDPVHDHSPISSSLYRSCRVKVVWTAPPKSEIDIEVWLPLGEHWNEKFIGTINSGVEKMVPAELAGGVARGFAVASMDFGIGTDRPDLYRIGIDNPNLAANFAYRGVHAMTLVAKQVATTFYGRPPAASIFVGSAGAGFQAIGEAGRYPDDYNGIIAGHPSLNYVNMGLSQGYKYVVSHRTAHSAIPVEALPLIADAVLKQCDGLDGLVDGLIDDPRRCKINFRRLACPGTISSGCLYPDQVATLEALYAGLSDPRTGRLIYPGFTPGAELSIGARGRLADDASTSFINPETPGPMVWSLGADFTASQWLTFDFGAGGDRHRAAFAPYENAALNLSAFAKRGGRLLLYTGWAETNLNPTDLIMFFDRLSTTTGARGTEKFARLFMAPGVYHGDVGPGPNVFGQRLADTATDPDHDVIMAMDRWLATGIAPEKIVATKFEHDQPAARILRQRPICAYPKVARWDRQGSIDEATSFTCALPGRR